MWFSKIIDIVSRKFHSCSMVCMMRLYFVVNSTVELSNVDFSVCDTPKGEKVYPASRRRSNKRVGLKGQLAPQCAMIKKFYHGIQKAVHQFRFKNVEQHLLLGSGGNQNLRPSCKRPPARTFHIPVGTLRFDVPALV